MGVPADERPPEAGKLPTGRVARTARVGGFVTGQGLRWAGMRTANRVRTPEKAAAAENERTAALVHELVEQLGRMRGAAMKVGQMISMVEFDGLPDEQQDELQRKLATLRDDVPPVPFARLEKLMRKEFGVPLDQVFSDFDERAFAAASIGQVHRATTLDGQDVVAKIQYPGVAEAVETDLRNAMLLLPLVKRLAPGLDARAMAEELRERVGEELDYELEAQNQRRIERLMRGHPFITIPRVYTDLSTRRVLVSEYIEGERFEEVRRAEEAQRDRYGEIVLPLLLRSCSTATGSRSAIPTPATTCCSADGRVCFLDFGLLRDVDVARVDGERAIALAVTREGRSRSEVRSDRRWLPAREPGRRGRCRLRSAPDAQSDQVVRGPRRASVLGRQPPPRTRAATGRTTRSEPRSERRSTSSRFRPTAILIRRMHGIVAIVLSQLRAGGDWGAIAAEYLHGDPPATPLGQAELEFFGTRRRRP